MIRTPFAFLALAALAAPAFADPAGVKISPFLIVSPVAELNAQEAWDLSHPTRQHNTEKPGALGVSLARESRPKAVGDWNPMGFVKVAYDQSSAPVVMRVWSRRGGPVFIKDTAAETGASASYKIQVGHESFTLSGLPDGAVHVQGSEVGRLAQQDHK
jgi:hypothetical protein